MENKDEILWQIARRRAAFKRHLFTYIVVCSFLWIVWFASSNGHYFYNYNEHFRFYRWRFMPWPAWVMFWWGIGLAFSFAKAYRCETHDAVEEEYRKLKNQQ